MRGRASPLAPGAGRLGWLLLLLAAVLLGPSVQGAVTTTLDPGVTYFDAMHLTGSDHLIFSSSSGNASDTTWANTPDVDAQIILSGNSILELSGITFNGNGSIVLQASATLILNNVVVPAYEGNLEYSLVFLNGSSQGVEIVMEEVLIVSQGTRTIFYVANGAAGTATLTGLTYRSNQGPLLKLSSSSFNLTIEDSLFEQNSGLVLYDIQDFNNITIDVSHTVFTNMNSTLGLARRPNPETHPFDISFSNVQFTHLSTPDMDISSFTFTSMPVKLTMTDVTISDCFISNIFLPSSTKKTAFIGLERNEGDTIKSGVTLTFTRCLVTRNTFYRGMVFIEFHNAHLEFIDSELSFNTGILETCGIYFFSRADGSYLIQDSRFLNNTSSGGAVIQAYSGQGLDTTLTSSIVKNCTFFGNLGTANIQSGSNPYSSAISFFYASTSYLEITDSSFISNRNTYSSSRGPIFLGKIDFPSVIIRNVNFTRNEGQFAGVICVDSNLVRLTMENVRAIGNTARAAGGVVQCFRCTILGNVTDSHFEGNVGTDGGAFYIGNGHQVSPSLSFRNVKFINNSGRGGSGGAVFVAGTSANVACHNCAFEENISGFGGAMYLADGQFSLSLTGDTYFTRNKATASGGTGGAIYIFKNILPMTISNMAFTGNTAAKGGAIYVASPSQSHIYTNITVKDCVGGLEGGGIWIEGTTLTLTDSYFEGNSAGTGAALFFRGANFGTSNLSRLTFRSHKSDQGTVAFSGGTRKIALSDIELTNNNDAFYATGTFAADLSLSRWTIRDNSNLKVDLSGIGRSLFMFSGFQGRFILENSRVYNSSYPVGSLFSVDSSAGDTIVSNVTFENNRAPALHAQNRASVVISNCTFANNTAVVQDNPVILNFFGLTQNAKATISDSTFVDNRAGSLLTHSSGADSTISNSMFTNNAIFTSLFASSSGSLILSSAQVEQPVVAQPGSCISLTTFGNITILDSEFSNCASSTGPALASVRDRSTMVVYNTSFSNVHTSQGPAFKLSDASTLTMDGSRFSQIHTGAVSLAGYALEASIKNTVFESSDSSSLSPIYLRVSEGARLHLEGSTFSDGTSQSSPCIYVDSASLNMTDCTLSGCSSGGQGGALTLFGSTVFEAINTTFTGNSALSGGALSFIQLSEALVTFTDCSFVENSAEGGGVLTSAVSTGNVILFKDSVFQSNTANTFGGVFLGTDYTQMTFEDCLFEDNNAETAGIGYLDWNAVVHFLSSSAEENRASDRGGAFYLEKLSKLILKDSSFTSSTAGNETTLSAGGLIFMTSKAHLKVHRSTIKKCYTYGNGGAIYVNPENQCTMEIVDSKFDGNQALRLRAVEPDQESAPTYGGAIYFNAISTAAFVVNTTAFEQSTADYGGAISSQSIYFPFLNENTFVDNQASIFGPDIFSPPDGTTLSLESFEILSGDPIPTFSLELLDHFGQRYILPPSPTITILVSLREIQTFGPGQAYLKGQTAGTFTNGTLEFSSSDARIRVYGPEGQYRLSVAPIPSDVYFKDADYIHEVIVTIKPCTGTNSMVLDLSCQPIQCLDCTFGECVSPNNCSCNAGWEGLGCNAPKDGYDNIKLRMKELPRLPTQAKRDGSTGITVEMRTYLINQVAASLDGMNVTVVYRAFYQEGDYYVFKYSLTDQAGMYIEGSQLDQYSSVTTEYFATELNTAGASADLNAAAAKYLTLGDPLVVVVLVLVLLMLAITIFTLVVVWFKRNTPIIRSASPLFCMIILVGLILAYLTIIPYIGEPTRVSCMAPVVLGPLAFSVVYGNLLAKTFRIYRIFSNRKMRAVAPTNKMLLGFSGVVVAIEMILVAAWLIADAPVPINAGPAEHRFRSCHSDLNTTMSSIILAYNGVLLLFGTYLAVRTRNAFSAFKESQMIGFSIYSLTIFAIAVLPVLYAVDLLLEVQFAIRSFAILLVTTITLALLYGSKMMIIFFQPSKNTQDYFDQQMQKRSSSLPGFNMKNVGASARPTGSGSQINNSYEFQNLMTRASGYLLVLDNKPWSRWKKMFFVQYGEYFGFFDDEAAVDYHGGMYPIANWEVYRFSDSKMQIKYGSKTWSVDARDPQELDKWFDILTPSNRRSSMRHSTSDVIKIPAGAPSQE